MKLCFLCSKRHKTKEFTDEVFEKCMYYLKVRKLNGFKYKEIELPPQAQTLNVIESLLHINKLMLGLKRRKKTNLIATMKRPIQE